MKNFTENDFVQQNLMITQKCEQMNIKNCTNMITTLSKNIAGDKYAKIMS